MLLKEEKNDVNVQNIEKRQYAVDRLLEMHGINVNLQNKYGATALMMAVNRGHSEFVKMLLGKKENDLYIRNKQGSNAIMLAIDQEQQIQSFATFAIVQMFIFAKKI